MALESVSANLPPIGLVNKDSKTSGWSGHAKTPVIGKELEDTPINGNNFGDSNEKQMPSKTEEYAQDTKKQEKRKGEMSSFNNEIAGKKPILCKYYVNSICSKGNDCPFLHKEFPCKFFHSEGDCSKQNACKFSHEPLTEQTRRLLDQFNKGAKTAGQRFERRPMGFLQGGPPIKRPRMAPLERISPYDRMTPFDRMGPYERMASHERMSPFDQMMPHQRMAPFEQMASHQRMGPPQRMGPMQRTPSFIPSPDDKRLCKFFLEGRCSKGEDCTFSHGSSSAKPTTGVCRFFLNGGCNRRSDCPYLHKRLPCKFFNSDMQCSKGDSCTYSHEPFNEEDQKDGEEGADDTYNHNSSSGKTVGVCRYFLNGACTKGDDCPFLHKRQPCKYYHSGLQCSKGDDCTYSHEPLNSQSQKALEESLDNGKSYGSNRNAMAMFSTRQSHEYPSGHSEMSEYSFGGQQSRPFGTTFNNPNYGFQSSRPTNFFSSQYGNGGISKSGGWKVPDRASIPWMRFNK